MKIIKLFGVIILFISMMGCTTTPTTQIAAFGAATVGVTEKIDSILKEYNDQYILAQMTLIAARYNGSKPLTPTIIREKIKLSATTENKKGYALYQLNNALGAYAKAIQFLSNAGSTVDIQTASANLYGSFVSINEPYKQLTNSTDDLFKQTQFSTIAAIISSIGQMIAEEKKREALKTIITKANANIVILCDAMIGYLDQGDFGSAISAIRNQILGERVLEYNKQIQSASKPNLQQRTEMITVLVDETVQMNNALLINKKAIKAIEAVKSAHNILTEEVQKNVYSSGSISLAIAKLKDIENNYDDFRAVLLECKSIKFEATNGKLKCKT